MDATLLRETITNLLESGKGFLAADESTSTVEKHFFAPLGLDNTEEYRRAYREMLFTTPEIGKYISGVIMYDETIRQHASDGRTFVSVLQDAGIVPGIKVDQGTIPMPDSPDEKLTKGIDGLPQRLKEYFDLGARFAKWRAVITISDNLPTDTNLEQNALDLAMYARMCQESGLVPIVEPEVLMDGTHSMAECENTSTRTLRAVFAALEEEGVSVENVILKTNMVVPGSDSGEIRSPIEIADATLRVFRETLPGTLPGQAFLSGGQSETEATRNLNAIAQKGPHPWKITFSYGRALQESAAHEWGGTDVAKGQAAFLKRARLNNLAAQGTYVGE